VRENIERDAVEMVGDVKFAEVVNTRSSRTQKRPRFIVGTAISCCQYRLASDSSHRMTI